MRDVSSFFARRARLRWALLPVLAVGLSACAAATPEIPTPRRLVIYSGERLEPTREQMEAVDAWVREEMDSISADPSFMIITQPEGGPIFPWLSLEVNESADTARIGFQGSIPEARGPYLIYAHLHLMAKQNRLDKWLPEAASATAFELERAIMGRMADSWLYSRSVFDATPYGLLDELVYAKEAGYLDAYILTARPDAFVDARRGWLEDNPKGQEEYRQWFRATFQQEPPGMRGATSSGR